MLRSILVYVVFVCLTTLAAPIGVVAQTKSDQPTVGGKPAFATSADVKVATIRSLLEAKEYAQAEKLATELTTESPQVVDGWLMLAYSLGVNGKFEESNRAYDQALERGADRQEVYTRKAYNCRRLGDPELTRACYDEILEHDANNIEILMQYGNFEVSIEQYQQAIRRFEAVLALQPDYVPAIEAVAGAEKQLGNSAQVKYWIEQGLTHEPNNERLLKQISLIYLNEQNYTMSIHYLDKLIAIDPANDAAHRNRGIALYQQGEKREAMKAFEKVRDLGGSLDGLYGPLADCYRASGRSNDALDIIKSGIDAGSQEAWLYSVWGKILEDRRNYDGAIAKFSQAVSLNDEPWSGYARKQINRQAQLKKRAKMIAAQGGAQ
jgi:tetratricopeptide (TPR) repeat protein